ncbi:MAG: hypothetical protein ABI629_14530 [bacterium]
MFEVVLGSGTTVRVPEHHAGALGGLLRDAARNAEPAAVGAGVCVHDADRHEEIV